MQIVELVRIKGCLKGRGRVLASSPSHLGEPTLSGDGTDGLVEEGVLIHREGRALATRLSHLGEVKCE
jgi:hypothetical protein